MSAEQSPSEFVFLEPQPTDPVGLEQIDELHGLIDTLYEVTHPDSPSNTNYGKIRVQNEGDEPMDVSWNGIENFRQAPVEMVHRAGAFYVAKKGSRDSIFMQNGSGATVRRTSWRVLLSWGGRLKETDSFTSATRADIQEAIDKLGATKHANDQPYK